MCEPISKHGGTNHPLLYFRMVSNLIDVSMVTVTTRKVFIIRAYGILIMIRSLLKQVVLFVYEMLTSFPSFFNISS